MHFVMRSTIEHASRQTHGTERLIRGVGDHERSSALTRTGE
jgi:hypothetical protein